MSGRNCMLIKRWTRDRKVVSLNPSRSGRRIFFSRVKFVCWISFSACSTPLLLQRHVKYPGHSAKSAGGRLHLNTHSPLTQRSQSGMAMLLSRHSEGTYLETSSHVTRQGTLGHSHHSSLSHCWLILAKEWNLCTWANLHFKKKRRRWGMNGQN